MLFTLAYDIAYYNYNLCPTLTLCVICVRKQICPAGVKLSDHFIYEWSQS